VTDAIDVSFSQAFIVSLYEVGLREKTKVDSKCTRLFISRAQFSEKLLKLFLDYKEDSLKEHAGKLMIKHCVTLKQVQSLFTYVQQHKLHIAIMSKLRPALLEQLLQDKTED
jgi:hypothetical protein